MFYPRTARQDEFVAVAATLADQFTLTAAEQDRTGTFPYANFDAIRQTFLPRLVVPVAYGGLGADLLETVMVLERLAVGDGSTALSFTMHLQTLGSAAETIVAGGWPPDLFARLCADVVARGALINSCASEPELGSPSRGGRPKTTACLRDPGADPNDPTAVWFISGRKSFASLAPALDYFIIPATLTPSTLTPSTLALGVTSPADTGQQGAYGDVARFLVPRSDAIEILQTWDAMGMRTTGSHDIILHDVCVPGAGIIARSSQSTGGGANAWFLLGVSAVYLGIAEAALAAAADYAQQRVPTALGRPIATLEAIQRHLGEAAYLIEQSRAVLYHNAQLWNTHPAARGELAPLLAVAKVTVTNNAVAAVDHCLRAAGGASLTHALPLERFYRDVRAGLHHPIGDDEAYLMLGKQALAGK
jgi:alkylation response protein AidB-like acyl-CoA dehydrogenase